MKNSNVKNLIGEIQLNYKRHETAEIIKILSSRDVNNYIRQFYPLEQINHRGNIYPHLLNNSNKITWYYLLSIGRIIGTLVDIRVNLKVSDYLSVSKLPYEISF